MPQEKCKACGRIIGPPNNLTHSVVEKEGDMRYVAVINTVPYLMRAGDVMCHDCNKLVRWYRRVATD